MRRSQPARDTPGRHRAASPPPAYSKSYAVDAVEVGRAALRARRVPFEDAAFRNPSETQGAHRGPPFRVLQASPRAGQNGSLMPAPARFLRSSETMLPARASLSSGPVGSIGPSRSSPRSPMQCFARLPAELRARRGRPSQATRSPGDQDVPGHLQRADRRKSESCQPFAARGGPSIRAS